jgi:hypothetical protein
VLARAARDGAVGNSVDKRHRLNMSSFLMVHAKVDETNDFVQSTQVQLLGLLGGMSDGAGKARRTFEIVPILHPRHDFGLAMFQIGEAVLATLAGAIVIQHFEIHFELAVQCRLGNGLDRLAIVGDIRMDHERDVIAAVMVDSKCVAMDFYSCG